MEKLNTQHRKAPGSHELNTAAQASAPFGSPARAVLAGRDRAAAAANDWCACGHGEGRQVSMAVDDMNDGDNQVDKSMLKVTVYQDAYIVPHSWRSTTGPPSCQQSSWRRSCEQTSVGRQMQPH